MSDTSTDLELLLREKEELIDALTERLELTAEQLDRLQRSSGERGHWLAGGIPAELVEQQQTLCEDLERVVQQWEDSQPTTTLNRIEMQLVELRDLIAQNGTGGGGGHGGYREEAPQRHGGPEPTADSAPSGATAWEAMKASLLGQSGGDSAPAESGQPDFSGPDPFDGVPLNPPEAVDLDSADPETLRNAVIARDDFIAELLGRLRSIESRTRPADTWKSLESVPEELRGRLESLERRLEHALRMSEVELSLERAKLGREASRVKQLEENTQKAMDRLGIALAAQEAEDDDDEPQQDTSPDGRWLRMLGIKREK